MDGLIEEENTIFTFIANYHVKAMYVNTKNKTIVPHLEVET